MFGRERESERLSGNPFEPTLSLSLFLPLPIPYALALSTSLIHSLAIVLSLSHSLPLCRFPSHPPPSQSCYTLLGVQHVAVIVKKTGEKQSFLQQRKISESFSNDIVGVDFWVDSTFGRFLTFFQDDDVRLRNVVPVVIIGFVVR